MASTEGGRRLTELHREAQFRIGLDTVRQLDNLWVLLNAEGRIPTVEAWLEAVMLVLGRQHRISAEIARTYYTQFALQEHAEQQLLAWEQIRFQERAARVSMIAVGPAKLREGIRRGLDVAEAARRAREAVAREGMRIALDGGRRQIIDAVQRDRRALGWIRVTDGDPCAFCAMLASRGPVYKGRETAIAGTVFSTRVNDFQAHASCGCQAEPVFTSTTEWPGRGREFRDLWNRAQSKATADPEWASKGTKNDALNNFRRLLEESRR